MSGILHVFLGNEIVLRVSLQQLSTLEHAVWQSFVVTSSNHKDTWIDSANLDHLEVMRKVSLKVDIAMGDSLLRHV